jgi:alkaline phosphatase
MKKNIILLFIILINIFTFSYKYIFFFIGDGMGFNHISISQTYLEKNNETNLNLYKLESLSTLKTNSLNTVTDSAAAITAMMSFEKTYNEQINIDKEGKKISPITYHLKDSGYKIGIITKSSITDATPAGLYARTSNRKNHKEIADQLLKSNIDLAIGGGTAFFDNDKIKNSNFRYNNSLKQIPSEEQELILTNYSNVPFAIDSKTNYLKPGLEYALKKFSNDNFFILIEGARIDHASHAHDIKTMIYEMLELDSTLETALNFYNKHKNETLIIFTSDHETGGLSLGDGFLSISKIEDQKFSYEKIANTIKNTNNYDDFVKEVNIKGLEKEYNETKNSKDYTYNSPLIRKYLDTMQKKAGFSWSTYGHTMSNVPLFSEGLKYPNLVDNTKIFTFILNK